MAGPNFTLITELQTLNRRDFPLGDVTLLNPTGTTPLIDGEWLELDGTYKLVRGTGYNANPLVFPVHTERGRYDQQALGKANVIFLGMYEAETTVIHASAGTIGVPLVVGDPGATGRRVLAGRTVGTVAKGDIVVGYVSKVISATKIRFIHFGNQLIHTAVV
jgi:hypothetical protein